jgi:hypothetical protein
VPHNGGLPYRQVVVAEVSQAHRERAQRAQQLSARAREQASNERAAAERCEYLMADATGSSLREMHRQAADLHRQALGLYEEAARFQQLHAEHERDAAERAITRAARGAAISAPRRIAAMWSPSQEGRRDG